MSKWSSWLKYTCLLWYGQGDPGAKNGQNYKENRSKTAIFDYKTSVLYVRNYGIYIRCAQFWVPRPPEILNSR